MHPFFLFQCTVIEIGVNRTKYVFVYTVMRTGRCTCLTKHYCNYDELLMGLGAFLLECPLMLWLVLLLKQCAVLKCHVSPKGNFTVLNDLHPFKINGSVFISTPQ